MDTWHVRGCARSPTPRRAKLRILICASSAWSHNAAPIRQLCGHGGRFLCQEPSSLRTAPVLMSTHWVSSNYWLSQLQQQCCLFTQLQAGHALRSSCKRGATLTAHSVHACMRI